MELYYNYNYVFMKDLLDKKINLSEYDYYRGNVDSSGRLYFIKHPITGEKTKINDFENKVENFKSYKFYELDNRFNKDKFSNDNICNEVVVNKYKYTILYLNVIVDHFFQRLVNEDNISDYLKLLQLQLHEQAKNKTDFISTWSEKNNNMFYKYIYKEPTEDNLNDKNILKNLDFSNIFSIKPNNQEIKRHQFNLDDSNIISKGTYGEIHKYTNIEKSISLTIKYEYFDNEYKTYEMSGYYEILQKLNVNKLTKDLYIENKKIYFNTSLCNTISSLYIGSYFIPNGVKNSGYNLFLMPNMTGNIIEITPKIRILKDTELSLFLIKLLDQIICLYDKELYYLDMKLSNFLYICDFDKGKNNINTFNFMLGDIGSLSPNFNMGTYSIWPYNFKGSHLYYEKFFNKSNPKLKSKILAYIFVISIIFPYLNKSSNSFNITDNNSDNYKMSEFLTKELYNDSSKLILESDNKIKINTYINNHNTNFDNIEKIKFQNLCSKFKIKLYDDSITNNFQTYFYDNIWNLNELRNELLIISEN